MPKVFEAPPGFVLNPDYLVPELRAQRDALLEALRDLVQLEADGRTEYESAIPHWDAARAAIKAAEEAK